MKFSGVYFGDSGAYSIKVWLMIPIFIGNSLFTSGNHKEAFFIRKVGRGGVVGWLVWEGGSLYLKKKTALSPVKICWYVAILPPSCQLLAAYSTLDFTRSPLAGRGSWNLLPITPDMLPTATKHFDRAGYSELGQSLFNIVHEKGGGSTWISLCLV